MKATAPSAADPDPLARFLGAIDLGAPDVADRHDAYLAGTGDTRVFGALRRVIGTIDLGARDVAANHDRYLAGTLPRRTR